MDPYVLYMAFYIGMMTLGIATIHKWIWRRDEETIAGLGARAGCWILLLFMAGALSLLFPQEASRQAIDNVGNDLMDFLRPYGLLGFLPSLLIVLGLLSAPISVVTTAFRWVWYRF